ncbi:Mechanosensitive ion channel-domain-containing protein [Crucibulum laeve]|uniref:Mechanosensitive ion channel-domain-containing protein n=1 Tax=Crucibulum laeve TaxID=68775 RepID=A0A5C3MIP7_9AGAR|nr:Mechanosensitive ion channel-domain-containing protein [Crucibulum laeve]
MPHSENTTNDNTPPPIVIPKEQDYAPRIVPLESRPPTPQRIDDDSDSDTTATNSSDEFDWDEDEDKKDAAQERVKAKRLRRLWLGFMQLARPVRVLLVSTIGVAFFITPLLVVDIRFKGSVIRNQIHVWSLWFTIIYVSCCVTYMVVDSIPRIVLGVISLFGGQVERLKTTVELTMAVSGWLKLALSISWAWISLSILRAVYEPFGSYWVIINRVMQVLFAAVIILLVEKLYLHFVAINFHEKALAERLAENRLGLKALDRLSNAQPALAKKTPYARRGHRSPGSVGTLDMFNAPKRSGKEGYESVDGSPIRSEKGENTPPKSRKKGTQRRKKPMTSVIVDQIGQVALKNSKFNKEGEFGGLHSARRLARKLFDALSDVHPARQHLIVEDFYPYFRSTAQAHEAFELFDKDGNGDITKKEMREAVQRIYRERKALVAGLKDVGSIVAKLDAVLLSIALVLIIFVCLLIFNRTNTLASLVPLATIILGFSFIFGHSAQTLFESLIFIFSTHVFDVGDLVMIDDQVLFVTEFGLFSTTFRRVDGQTIIAPNALLASAKLVHNLRRSKSMWETTNLTISYDTPVEVIEQLRIKIQAYVNANNREWSGFALHIDKMEFQNAIHLICAMEHRPNWQDWGGRWSRRTAFMRNLKIVLEELDIKYTMPVQPVLLPSSHPPNAPQMQSPPTPRPGNAADLGNAGFFQPSEHLRAPGRTFSAGIPSFG